MQMPAKAADLVRKCVRHVTVYTNGVLARLHNRKVVAYTHESGVVLLFTNVHTSVGKDAGAPIHYRTRGNMGQLSVNLSPEAAAALYGCLHDLFHHLPVPPANTPLPERQSPTS
jgi:hypothetical protein